MRSFNKNIAGYIGITIITCILLTTFKSFCNEKTNDLSLSDLYSLKIPVVFTASKQSQSIVNSPSVMSVIDDNEIKIRGYRSVEDALFQTVGFWPTRQFTWNGIIGSRGLVQDKNSHYLFLVDGHSINTIGDAQNHTYQFPTIDKIKKIEIVRGPGSTMWGSDAALGIINLITKNGDDINGLSVNVELESFPKDDIRDKLPFNETGNIMYGKKIGEDIDAMISLTAWNGDGWMSKNQFPWQSEYESTIPIQAYDQNWDLYAKLRAKDFSLKADFLRGKDVMGWTSTPDLANRTANIWKYFWMEGQYNHNVADSITFEAKIFADFVENTYFLDKAEKPVPATASGEYTNMPTNDLGVEGILSGSNFKNHQWKIGLRYVRTYIGPSVGERTYLDSNAYRVGDAGNNMLLYNKDGIDNLTGLYLEDQWQIHKMFVAILGGRVDYNNLREHGSQFMPRGGLIFKPREYLSFKYLMNSGYLRPSQFQAANYRFHNVKKSESIYSHDLQALFQNRHTSLTATAYIMRIRDYITWVDATSVGNTVIINLGANGNGNYNVGDFTSKGVELEVKQTLGKKVSAYSNYSYGIAKLGSDLATLGIVNKDMAWHGVPRQIYTVGFDVNPVKNLAINLNWRGWDDITAKKTATDAMNYWTLKGSGMLGAAVSYNKIANLPLSASLYCFNLLNEDDPIADVNVGGPASPKPRMVSFKIGYTF